MTGGGRGILSPMSSPVDAGSNASRTLRLDVREERLWRGGDVVSIPPKALQLLVYFAERAGTRVSRKELLTDVWPGVTVSADAVRYGIRQMRLALGDDSAEPRFLETIPGRGWRFIGKVSRAGPSTWLLDRAADATEAPDPRPTAPLVGREVELGLLRNALERARAGERQVLFINGEAGIGKTALLRAFFAELGADRGAIAVHGQCLLHRGRGEPYLPVLEALERLCLAIGGETPRLVLRRHAPMWLAQLPSISEPEERADLQREIQGASQERMRREFVRAIEALCVDRSLVFWFDDLHWCDAATLELLAWLAARRESARLLVVATSRPPDDQSGEGLLRGLQRDLLLRGDAQEHELLLLDRAAVEAYLRERLPVPDRAQAPDLRALADFLHERTEGNPLFLVAFTEELIEREVIHHDDEGWKLATAPESIEAPATIQQLLERELQQLDEAERDLLETASIAGMEFSAASLAPAEGSAREDAERRCSQLARARRFLVPCAAGADGTSRFAFVHSLYREALESRLPPIRRARLHREIGQRKAAAYVGREAEIAAELARHFEWGQAAELAIPYFTMAAEEAARRFANVEAVRLFRDGNALLREVAPSPDRDLQELHMRLVACVPLAAVGGYGSDELAENLARIEAIGSTLTETPAFSPVLLALWSLHVVRTDFDRALDVAGRLLHLAEAERDPVGLLQGHRTVGHALFYRGDLTGAREHHEKALSGYDVETHERLDYSVGDDPLVLNLSYESWLLWYLGQPEQAVDRTDRAVALAERLGHPPSLAIALAYSTLLHMLRRDDHRGLICAERLGEIAEENGMALWVGPSQLVRGWALAEQGAALRPCLAEMEAGIEAWRATGSSLGLPQFLSLLAETTARSDDLERSMALVRDAAASIAGSQQVVFEPERLRVEGELRVQRHRSGDLTEAGRCFRRAIRLAREQHARSPELRATLSLARWLERDGRLEEGQQLVAEAYSTFREGFADPDLQAARRFLDQD